MNSSLFSEDWPCHQVFRLWTLSNWGVDTQHFSVKGYELNENEEIPIQGFIGSRVRKAAHLKLWQ